MSALATPPDHEPRDRIRSALGESLFVDAGAGSGKTTALVGRVVELVRSGVPMSRIAAITFTEAATAELRDRLRRSLVAAAETSDLFGQEVFLRALDELDGAAIHTLHAFAQRILRQFPVEAGLPPAIDVSDEIASVVRFEDRWRAFLDEWENDERWHPAFRRFLQIRGTEGELADLARVFNDHWDRLPPPVPVEPPEVPPVDLAPILAPLRQAIALGERCVDPADLLAVHLRSKVLAAVVELEAAGPGDLAVALLRDRSLPKFTSKLGKGPNWGGTKAEVVELLAEAQGARELAYARATAPVLSALREQVAAFVVESAERRRRAGQLEFHDLLVLARDLLRDHPEVRATLADSYDALLLDEFQDTDPLQLDLAGYIASGADASAEPPPGRLFFVGDPKQSIYRFRRADLSLYLDTRHRFAAGLCELSANFRTVPGVIDWVNGVFANLMDGDDGQAPYLPLVAVRPPLGDGRPPVIVAGGATDLAAADVRHEGADDLASILGQMLDEGWPVHDGDVEAGGGPGSLRPVRHDDICVLVPSRLAVPALEDAFERAGLPYRLLTSSLIWTAQEVREVVAVLHAIDDPGDEVHLVAALRSPLFACTDDALAEWSGGGGRWSYLFAHHPTLGADHPVAAALAALAELHRDRWWLGPDGLIDRLLVERAGLELAAVAGRRRDRWRRLRFLADQAQAFVESQRGDLTQFLRWVELQSSDVVRVSSPVLPEADDPAIRVMTIHGSKGLEFPVVALFGLGVSTRLRAASVLWSDEGAEVRFSGDLRSAGYDDLRTAEEQMELAERIRLLYVGATRARDRLVVCTHHKATATPSASPSLGALFERALADLDPADVVRWHRDADGATGREVPPPPALPLPMLDRDDPRVVEAGVERARFQSDRAELLGASHRAVWSATAVAKVAQPDAIDTDAAADDVATVDGESVGVTWRRGRAGTAIGRAVHGTLQLVDLPGLARLDGIARAQAVAEGVDAHVDAVAGLARAGATSTLVTELTARRHWREMYVAAPVEGVTVEGYVDLLADDGDGGLVVVDYKTDSVRGPADVAERTERYRLQAATYALALEAVTALPVTRAVFLFLGREGAIESPVDDLERAKSDARAILARRGSSPSE